MEPLVQSINVMALQRAVAAFVGPQATQAIGELYLLLDRTMKDGYDLGFRDGQDCGETKLDVAFDNGFEEGARFAYETNGDYDEGYLDGVMDARAHPALADETVADIISDLTQHAINGEFDITLVTDSGDEA